MNARLSLVHLQLNYITPLVWLLEILSCITQYKAPMMCGPYLLQMLQCGGQLVHTQLQLGHFVQLDPGTRVAGPIVLPAQNTHTTHQQQYNIAANMKATSQQ